MRDEPDLCLRLIRRVTPLPDARGDYLELECGHTITTFGWSERAGTRLPCTACQEAGKSQPRN